MLCQKCAENKSIIKRLRMHLRLSKSHARQTKHQKKIDYDWDGEEANFADSVSTFVQEYLFLRCKFLKDKWMEYDNNPDACCCLYRGR
jgi:hypothetical protein